MKARFILSPIVLLVALSIVLSSCTDAVNKLAQVVALNHTFEFEQKDTVKWGKIVEKDLDLPSFSTIDAEGLACVVYTKDSVCSVRVRANEKCLDAYKFEVRKNELETRLKDSKKINKNTPGIILYVSAPYLSNIELSGGGKVELRGNIDMPGTLEVELNGACNLVIDTLSVDELNLEGNGATKCNFAKVSTKENIEIELNGAGDIDANVFCQDLRIQMNGAGKGVFSGECKKLICEENGASKVDFSKLKR